MELVLEKLIDGIITEECFEMHWLVKSGIMDMDELLGIEPIPRDGFRDLAKSNVHGARKLNGGNVGLQSAKHGTAAKKGQGFGLNTSAFGSQVAQCPICSQLVAGSRFAPHLERCLGGGKRAGRGHFSSLEEVVKKVKSQPFVDPHPNSAIVRIKLRSTDGLPLVKQVREGVTVEEWSAAVESRRG
jgi:hypothetical protein